MKYYHSCFMSRCIKWLWKQARTIFIQYLASQPIRRGNFARVHIQSFSYNTRATDSGKKNIHLPRRFKKIKWFRIKFTSKRRETWALLLVHTLKILVRRPSRHIVPYFELQLHIFLPKTSATVNSHDYSSIFHCTVLIGNVNNTIRVKFTVSAGAADVLVFMHTRSL